MPPVNDDFANATVIAGASGNVVFSNVGATMESGEPANAEGHSVWFKYTPTQDGTVEVWTSTTPLPDWDSYLSVLVGTSVSALSEITNADDNDFQAGHTDSFGTSRVTWDGVGGTTYYIQVTAWDDVSGPVERSDLQLSWSFVVAAPVLTSANAGYGVVGDTVVLHGTDLNRVTSVVFGSHAASFVINSSIKITTTVPAGSVGSRLVTVLNAVGHASSLSFLVLSGTFSGGILTPGDPVPPDFTAGPWQTLASDEAYFQKDLFPASANNRKWSAHVSGPSSNLPAILESTSGRSEDVTDWGLGRWIGNPLDTSSLMMVLIGVRVPANPVQTVDSLYSLYIGPGGLPDGVAGIQVETENCTLLGPTKLHLVVTSGTHTIAADYYEMSYYDAPWAGGEPVWGPSGGSPELLSPTLEPVSAATARTFRGSIIGLTSVPTTPIVTIPLPDFSDYQTWSDGAKGVAIRGIPTAALEGLAPDSTQTSASFTNPTAGAFMLFRLPRYRYLYLKTTPPPQRQWPRDDGLAISQKRATPVPTTKQFGLRRGAVSTVE